MKKRILLVDGMALLFRGFYATAYQGNFMRTKDGTPTNGIFQFLRYFLDAVDTIKPTHVICCWDLGKQTFRTELYANYKANRDDPPEELVPQFSLVKEVVQSFDIPNISLENYEADDCIGTLVKSYNQHETIILTGDLDMLQLVSTQTKVAIMRKGIGNYEIFEHGNFYEKQGLEPRQMIDFKALVGDPADHYPGIKGIGKKTALTLLQKYDSIEKILKHRDELTKSMQKRIEEGLHFLETFQVLAKIKQDLPITCSLENAVWNIDKASIRERLQTLSLHHLGKLI